MPDPRVNVVLGAKDEATKVVTGLRGQFEKFRKDAVTGFGLGAGIGVFNAARMAIGEVTDFLGDSARMAAEEEAEIIRLTASLEANARGWDGNVAAVETWIQTNMRATAFADSEQRDALTKLVGVTGDLTEAQGLLTTAMDLARFRGMDLAAAGDLIGKVYAGNLGTLSKYGIVLDKGATATEALAEIQRRAKGQAIAFGASNQGAAERAKIAWSDAQESIGGDLTDLMRQWDEFVFGVATGISDMFPGPGADRLTAILDELGSPEKVQAAAEGVDVVKSLFDTVQAGFDVLDPAKDEMEDFWRVNEEGARKAGLTHLDFAASFNLLKDVILAANPALAEGQERGAAAGRIMAEVIAKMGEIAPAAKDAADAVATLTGRTEEETAALQGLAAGFDTATGSFKSFWEAVDAQQKQVRYFIRHPGKVREELDRIEAAIARSERQKTKLEADGTQKRDLAALAAIDARLLMLRGRQAEFFALGAVYGNKLEAGFESGYDPSVDVSIRGGGGKTSHDPPRRAHGGPVSAGQTFLVGESGPEFLHMGSQSGHVTPDGGGSMRPIVVNVDGHELFRIMDARGGSRYATAGRGSYYRTAE